jgi:hypothetical protein
MELGLSIFIFIMVLMQQLISFSLSHKILNNNELAITIIREKLNKLIELNLIDKSLPDFELSLFIEDHWVSEYNDIDINVYKESDGTYRFTLNDDIVTYQGLSRDDLDFLLRRAVQLMCQNELITKQEDIPK